MQLNFVVWTAAVVPNAAVLNKLSGVDDEWELNEGVPRAEGFPSDATFQVNLNRPHDTLFPDSLKNTDFLVVVSERLKDLLAEWELEEVEFLPITILNHKRKAIADPYYIVHPIHPVPCLDGDKCGATWDKLDEDFIKYVERLVIREADIDAETDQLLTSRKLFRPKSFYRVTLVRRDIAEAIDKAGFTGVRWVELDDYSNA